MVMVMVTLTLKIRVVLLQNGQTKRGWTCQL